MDEWEIIESDLRTFKCLLTGAQLIDGGVPYYSGGAAY